MPTNDGYSPYPIGMTAAEAVAALRRAFDLDIELLGYVRYAGSDTQPVVADTKQGDFWYNTTTDKLYRAAIGDNAGQDLLLWFEV